MAKTNTTIKAWGIKTKEGLVYYACETFFGLQKRIDLQLSEHVKLIGDPDKQLFSGECDKTCWYEIAQQLWAISKGWV